MRTRCVTPCATRAPLNIDIQVATDGDDILIAVVDDGLGMDKAVADRLLAAAAEPRERSAPGQGTGMALRNVAERVERFFGVGSGVEIVSKPGEGTCVTLRLVGGRNRLVALRRERRVGCTLPPDAGGTDTKGTAHARDDC